MFQHRLVDSFHGLLLFHVPVNILARTNPPIDNGRVRAGHRLQVFHWYLQTGCIKSRCDDRGSVDFEAAALEQCLVDSSFNGAAAESRTWQSYAVYSTTLRGWQNPRRLFAAGISTMIASDTIFFSCIIAISLVTVFESASPSSLGSLFCKGRTSCWMRCSQAKALTVHERVCISQLSLVK